MSEYGLFHNRELSWLKFNERVMQQSQEKDIPLFERLRFLSIFQNNLDEFFMVRAGSLYDSVLMKDEYFDNKSGLTPSEQIWAIFEETRRLMRGKDDAYRVLVARFREQGLEHLDMHNLSIEQEEYLKSYYHTEIQPMLSPQIIDKHHPFPFLKNKEIYICAQLENKSDFVKLAIIPVTTGFNRLVFLPFGGMKFVLMDELVLKYCGSLFGRFNIVEKTICRVTRNADLNVDEALYDHDIDYRTVMEQMVKNRRKLVPVRLEFQGNPRPEIRRQLCSKLELGEHHVVCSETPLDFAYTSDIGEQLEKKNRDDLFYKKLIPQKSPLVNEDIPMIEQIEQRDILLSYPYEGMKPFIRLLLEAAADPTVLSIKMTLYRVARQSQIIAALIKAAENGKDIHVVVELRARFDEENNIEWSKKLEEAGISVIYGLGDYKVHSKLLIITRKKEGSISFITQVGTGNYNENTAKLYTDLCLMTADQAIGLDATRIFAGLMMGNPVEDISGLLAAPLTLKPTVIALLDEEIAQAKAGNEAVFDAKFNSFTDKEIIEKCIEASQAGVKIRLIIRGICCLRAGVPGLTDNIEVISIVGRFLEHSRVYIFGMGERRKMYISSADFMTRNTERRVEVAAPIYDKTLQKRILNMMDVLFSDNVKAQRLLPDGTYQRVHRDGAPIDGQIYLYKQAYAEAQSVVSDPPAVTEMPLKPQPLPEKACPDVPKVLPTRTTQMAQKKTKKALIEKIKAFWKVK